MSTETEIPRVSIDSLAQWREIRQNMMKAALQRLDERIRAGGLEAEREPMEAYIRKVSACMFSFTWLDGMV